MTKREEMEAALRPLLEMVDADYRKALAPIERVLERYPDNREYRVRHTALLQAWQNQRRGVLKPLVDLIAREPITLSMPSTGR